MWEAIPPGENLIQNSKTRHYALPLCASARRFASGWNASRIPRGAGRKSEKEIRQNEVCRFRVPCSVSFAVSLSGPINPGCEAGAACQIGEKLFSVSLL